jgi:hypothetical protein
MADTNYTKYRELASHFREYMTFDPASGVVSWSKVGRWRRQTPGTAVGCITKDGYRQGCIRNKSIYMHIVAWFLHYGTWPDGFVDHINGDRSDNRILNLRVISHAANIQNQRTANKRNKLGGLGVSLTKGRYRAAIRFNGVAYSLGSFDTAETAHAAYLAAKRRLHEGCTI